MSGKRVDIADWRGSGGRLPVRLLKVSCLIRRQGLVDSRLHLMVEAALTASALLAIGWR